MFGSDYPLITPDRWMNDFEQGGFRDEVKPLILKSNALRLLGLDGAAKAPPPPVVAGPPGPEPKAA